MKTLALVLLLATTAAANPLPIYPWVEDPTVRIFRLAEQLKDRAENALDPEDANWYSIMSELILEQLEDLKEPGHESRGT
jgi:hypothetical protein